MEMGERTYRLTPVFLGFLIESIQSINPYFTHLSQGLANQHTYHSPNNEGNGADLAGAAGKGEVFGKGQG